MGIAYEDAPSRHRLWTSSRQTRQTHSSLPAMPRAPRSAPPACQSSATGTTSTWRRPRSRRYPASPLASGCGGTLASTRGRTPRQTGAPRRGTSRCGCPGCPWRAPPSRRREVHAEQLLDLCNPVLARAARERVRRPPPRERLHPYEDRASAMADALVVTYLGRVPRRHGDRLATLRTVARDTPSIPATSARSLAAPPPSSSASWMPTPLRGWPL